MDNAIVETPIVEDAHTITERQSLTIFITGASTPLGIVATRHLTSAGHTVIGLAESAAGAENVRQQGGIPVFAQATRMGELKNIIALNRVDVVVHLANQAANHTPVKNADWRADTLEADTEAIVAAVAEAGAKFYVHTSYAFVYGDHEGFWVDETTRPTPRENQLLKAALFSERRALDGAVPSCILRLGYLYGAECPALETLTKNLMRGTPVYGKGGYANWLHLLDAAEAIRCAAEAQVAGGIYSIADFEPTSSAEFINQVAAALGIHAPSLFPSFAARLLLSQTQLDLLALSLRVKNTRALEELGWSPRFNDLKSDLDDVMLTWRTQLQV